MYMEQDIVYTERDTVYMERETVYMERDTENAVIFRKNTRNGNSVTRSENFIPGILV